MAERRMGGGSKGISIQKDHGYVCICNNYQWKNLTQVFPQHVKNLGNDKTLRLEVRERPIRWTTG